MYSWDNAQVVLVGNKCDLEQDRAVTEERGQRLADQLGKFICIYIYICWMYALIVFSAFVRHILLCFVLCCVLKGFPDKNSFMGKDSGDTYWK
jgi:GTPase SAR1 family protein